MFVLKQSWHTFLSQSFSLVSTTWKKKKIAWRLCSNCYSSFHENPRALLVPFYTLCSNPGQCSRQTWGDAARFCSLRRAWMCWVFQSGTSQTSVCTQITQILLRRRSPLARSWVGLGSRCSQVMLMLPYPAPGSEQWGPRVPLWK